MCVDVSTQGLLPPGLCMESASCAGSLAWLYTGTDPVLNQQLWKTTVTVMCDVTGQPDLLCGGVYDTQSGLSELSSGVWLMMDVQASSRAFRLGSFRFVSLCEDVLRQSCPSSPGFGLSGGFSCSAADINIYNRPFPIVQFIRLWV